MNFNFLLSPLIKPWPYNGPHCLESSWSIDNKHLSQVLWVEILVNLGDLLNEIPHLFTHVPHSLHWQKQNQQGEDMCNNHTQIKRFIEKCETFLLTNKATPKKTSNCRKWIVCWSIIMCMVKFSEWNTLKTKDLGRDSSRVWPHILGMSLTSGFYPL